MGYDLAVPGNHEFDYGIDGFLDNVKTANFPIICANILKDNKPLFEPDIILHAKSETDIGFFGIDTPETLTKSIPIVI